MRNWVILGVAAVTLAGCIPPGRPEAEQAPPPPAPPAPPPAAPVGPPMPIEGDSITLEVGPCHGRCPVYSVTMRPDGSGVFTGQRFTAVTGERPFTATRAQYADFAARLAPYRPRSGAVRYAPGEPNCDNAPTDMPTIDVTWMRAVGDSQRLSFYIGCRSTNAAMAQALGGASEALPIQAFIGPRP